MGTKERHERDREAVKRAILDAARDLFVSKGYENVSIRKIAERIESSGQSLCLLLTLLTVPVFYSLFDNLKGARFWGRNGIHWKPVVEPAIQPTTVAQGGPE